MKFLKWLFGIKSESKIESKIVHIHTWGEAQSLNNEIVQYCELCNECRVVMKACNHEWEILSSHKINMGTKGNKRNVGFFYQLQCKYCGDIISKEERLSDKTEEK